MTDAPIRDPRDQQLTLLAAKNERLADALVAARDQIVELKRQIDELAKPPGTYAVFVGARPDGTVDIMSAGRKMHVGTSPSLEVATLRPGQELKLNEAMTVVEAGGFERIGELVSARILHAAASAHNTFDEPDAVAPVDFAGTVVAGTDIRLALPPRSIVTVRVRAVG